MSWEINYGRRVYTRSVRQGQKIIRTWFGSGPRAEQAAAEDEARRAARAAQAKARRAEARHHAATLAPLIELGCLTDLTMQATLIAAGFHQHHGEWRRRHVHDHDHPATEGLPR